MFMRAMVSHPGHASNRHFAMDACRKSYVSVALQTNYYPDAAARRSAICLSRALALSGKLTISRMIDIQIHNDPYDSGKLIALVKTC
jgi:hypothetical protein